MGITLSPLANSVPAGRLARFLSQWGKEKKFVMQHTSNVCTAVDSKGIICYRSSMHNTDRDFWNGTLNAFRLAFFLARRGDSFAARGLDKLATMCEQDAEQITINALT